MRFQRLRALLPDTLAILLLVLLPLLVFWQVWASNPSDRLIFGGDILMGAYPTRVFVHQLLTSGALPLWNPYQLAGMPLIGDVQVAPYYLPNLLLDLIYRGRDLTYLGLEMLVIAHYVLGALFCYAYLRGLGLGWAAALVGAISFQFNGFFIGHRGHYNMLAVAVWLPGVLWLLDLSWRALTPMRSVAWAVVAGLALSQLVMAGHPQLALYASLVIIAYAAYRWLGSLRQPGLNWRARGRIPALFVLTGLLAAGIAAIALLPTLELLSRSRRSDLSYTFAAQYSLMPRNLLGLLMPDFLDWGATEFRIYAGILTLVLATVVWVVPARKRRERRFFGLLALVGFITALGGFTALHGLIYRFIPGFSSIRVSTRAFFVVNVALSVMAAFGMEKLLSPISEEERQRLRGMVRGLGILLGVGGLIGAGLYALIASNYHPVGEDFFFAESLFSTTPSQDTYTLLTQIGNTYGMFLVLLAGSFLLLWMRSSGRLVGHGLASAAALLMALDLASFAPYHDTIKADPESARFTIRQYATTMLVEPWKISDQDQLIAALRNLPDGVRIDNTAEVLPDNYSQIYRIAFATGYNILDIKDRFELLTQWPNLSDSLRRDLLNVGYVLTAADASEPPEAGATLVLQNSQGQLWQRAQQPAFAHFSTSLRPVQTSITLNGLLARPGSSLDAQTSLSLDHGQLATVMREHWPEALDPALYAIGTTGVRSPIDISILSGGPVQYSAVIVDGVTVTPEQRGIVIALIDPQSGEVLNAGGFDTYQSSAESDRLAALIKAAADGTIVALATYDEGIASLNEAGRTAIASLGASTDLKDQVGAAYALVGVKGSPAGSALEQIAFDAPVVLDVGMGALPSQPDVHFNSHMLSYQADQMSLLVQNDVRGLLIISESLFPGWEAYVDGLSTPILRANGTLRAVILPPALAGQPHEVTFVYRPLSVRLGGAISLFSLALAIGMLLAIAVATAPRISWRQQRQTEPTIA